MTGLSVRSPSRRGWRPLPHAVTTTGRHAPARATVMAVILADDILTAFDGVARGVVAAESWPRPLVKPRGAPPRHDLCDSRGKTLTPPLERLAGHARRASRRRNESFYFDRRLFIALHMRGTRFFPPPRPMHTVHTVPRSIAWRQFFPESIDSCAHFARLVGKQGGRPAVRGRAASCRPRAGLHPRLTMRPLNWTSTRRAVRPVTALTSLFFPP